MLRSGSANFHWADVDVEAEAFAEFEESCFGALPYRERIPLGAADCAEENRVGFAAGVEGFIWAG